MRTKILIAATAALLTAAPVFAHEHAPKPMGGMMMNDPSNPYAKAEMDMHMKMMAAKAGDASEKWTRKMIEHHRGAIAMSRVALTTATDEQTRQMAQMAIDMQGKDVAELQAWLKSHDKPPQ